MKKKNYYTPQTEVVFVETRYALCDNPSSDPAGGDPSAPYPAPKRPVF